MLKSLNNSTDFRILFQEFIFLEPEYFDQAKDISSQVRDESSQWQIYLNTLTLIALKEWLKERMLEQSISTTNQIIENTCSLKIGEFRVCVIATDNLLHELVYLPKNVVESPELATHFYVILEVLEEQEKVIFRGCLRYGQLVNYRNHVNLRPQDNFYQLPLSLFDTEPNHLLFYCRFLEPTSIPIPVVSAQITAEKPVDRGIERVSVLSWFQAEASNLIAEFGWRQIDFQAIMVGARGVTETANPQTALAKQLTISNQPYELKIIPLESDTWGFELRSLALGGMIPTGFTLRLLTAERQSFSGNEAIAKTPVEMLYLEVALDKGEGLIWEIEPTPDDYHAEVLKF